MADQITLDAPQKERIMMAAIAATMVWLEVEGHVSRAVKVTPEMLAFVFVLAEDML